MANRPVLPLNFGEGLDRASGSTVVAPERAADIRSVYLAAGVAEARKGIVLTRTMPDTDSIVLLHLTHRFASNFAIGYESFPTDELRLEIDGLDEGVWLAGANIASDHAFFAGEVGNVIMVAAATHASGDGIVTKYYNTSSGAITTFQASFDGGAAADVKFRGVCQHLDYMVGWGFGSASEGGRGDIIRVSLPGQPTVFKKEHYFIAGARDPVRACISLGAGGLMVLKHRKLFRILGDNRANFGIFEVDPDYGVICNRLACSYRGALYFWSEAGPRVSTGGPSEDIGRSLGLNAPLPSDLVSQGFTPRAFAHADQERKEISFVFDQRAYVLHMEEPEHPRWSFREYGVSLRCASQWFYTTESKVVSAVGVQGGGRIGALHRTALDFDTAVKPRLQTAAAAPYGPAGEATFHAVHLTVTHTMACTLRLTALVDGAPQGEVRDVTLASKATRTTEVFEVALYQKYVPSATDEGRYALRGSFFAVKIEVLVSGSPGIATGDLLIEQVAVEHEQATETRVAV
jgi:hypothetical protein